MLTCTDTHSAKFHFEECLVELPENCSDVLRTAPHGPICNTNEFVRSGMSLGRTQDINLFIIHK